MSISPSGGLAAFRAQLVDITAACRYPNTGEHRKVDPEAGGLAYEWCAEAVLRRHRRSGYWIWDTAPVMYPPTAPDLALCWAEKLASEARVAFARELAVVLARVFPREVTIRIYLEVFWGEGR
jgi:hypothetical protein